MVPLLVAKSAGLEALERRRHLTAAGTGGAMLAEARARAAMVTGLCEWHGVKERGENSRLRVGKG
jgi:hypothetical protein